MTRDELLADVIRVADEVGVHVAQLSRGVYRVKGQYGDNYRRIDGSWQNIRTAACNALGDKPHDQDIVEREDSRAQVSYIRQLERQVGRPEAMARRLETCITKAFEKHPVVVSSRANQWKPKKAKKMRRMLSVLLSDLHFGVLVKPSEVYGSEYTWEIARRRLAQVMVQAAEWKPDHRDETELTLILNGDIIEGVIHMHDQLIMPLTEQLVGATHLLVGAIDFLLQHFPRVNVVCTPGNHGRVTHRGTGRTIAQRWDSHEHAIYLGLEMAFRGRPEVAFNIPQSGIAHYLTPGGHLVVISHGDTAPTVGNVGSAINTEKMANQLRAMDTARIFDRPIDILACGHWHTPANFMLPHGAHVLVNGCLIGGASFSQNGVGAWNAEPAQILFESVEHHPLGDTRTVRVHGADKDRSLDAVIRPISLERAA